MKCARVFLIMGLFPCQHERPVAASSIRQSLTILMQINNKNQNLDMIPFVTTKKQSETIISCGVDPITADLSYIVFPNGHLQYYVGQHKM